MYSFVIFGTILFIATVYSAPQNASHFNKVDDEKIVGGRFVEIEELPHQVSISDTVGYWCGGSIISKYHVLTAAHCIYYAYHPLTVRAGSKFFDQGGSIHEVIEKLTLGNTKYTDIGLIRVKEPFVFDKTRQAISLFIEDPKPDTLAVISGWGDTSPQFRLPSTQLKAVDVPIVSRDVCNKIYEGTEIGNVLDGQICAGYLNQGGKDACHGDSGSPLVVNGKQAGVASLGLGCARKGMPGVYSDVARYNDWIQQHIKNDKLIV